MFVELTYLILMLPGLLLMLWAQGKVRHAYGHYARVGSRLRLSGAQVARAILDAEGLDDVGIELTPGELTDHYDPRRRVLRLSPDVFAVPSIAAIGIAAHEAGHAIQHARAYVPLRARTALVPLVGVGSNAGLVLVMVGLLGQLAQLAWLGVGLFALATILALVTLPVEFDATRRATEALRRLGLADLAERRGVADVLDAAAWTYVAGFALSLLQLLYWVGLVGGARSSES